MKKIGPDYNPSDIGTKALGPLTFLRHLQIVVKSSPSHEQVQATIKAISAKAEALDTIAQIATDAALDEWKVVTRQRGKSGLTGTQAQRATKPAGLSMGGKRMR